MTQAVKAYRIIRTTGLAEEPLPIRSVSVNTLGWDLDQRLTTPPAILASGESPLGTTPFLSPPIGLLDTRKDAPFLFEGSATVETYFPACSRILVAASSYARLVGRYDELRHGKRLLKADSM